MAIKLNGLDLTEERDDPCFEPSHWCSDRFHPQYDRAGY